MKKITEILKEWKTMGQNIKNRPRPFFGELDLFGDLTSKLALHQSMTMSEIVATLHVIENLAVQMKSKSSAKVMSFGDWLAKHHSPGLKDLDIAKSGKTARAEVTENNRLFHLLFDTHKSLFERYVELSENPIREITYNAEQLEGSKAFQELEEGSKEDHLPDKANIVRDVRRRGVTFYGAIVHPGDDPTDDHDPLICKTILNFATVEGDEEVTRQAKASKIFNFGGQFLEAVVLKEFANTMRLPGVEFNLERGPVKGHINWSKSGSNIYASVDMKIFTCAYADPVDTNEPQRHFAMAKDGKSLVELNDDELGEIMEEYYAGLKGTKENTIVPICKLKAKIALTENPDGDYELRVVGYKAIINTPDLVCINDPKVIEQKDKKESESFSRGVGLP